jgi:hypothetical protein
MDWALFAVVRLIVVLVLTFVEPAPVEVKSFDPPPYESGCPYDEWSVAEQRIGGMLEAFDAD